MRWRALIMGVLLVGVLGPPVWANPRKGLAPVVARTELPASLLEGETALGQGQWTVALTSLMGVLQSPTSPEIELRARLGVGKALKSLGYPISALRYLVDGPPLNQVDPITSELLSLAAGLSQEVGWDRGLGRLVGELPVEDLPAEGRNTLLLAGGVELCRQGHCLDAAKRLGAIPAADPLGLEARVQLVRALTFTNQGNIAYAVQKQLLLDDEVGLSARPGGLPLAHLTLARLAYGMGQYEEAITTYQKVPSSSDYWPDAVMERAWAHYALWQIKDSTRDLAAGLGDLWTITAPQLANFYYPEAWLLLAQVDYFLCKPASGSQVVEQFMARYKPVDQALSVALADPATTPEHLFEMVQTFRLTGQAQSPVPRMALNLFLTDQRFEFLATYLDDITAEKKRIQATTLPPAQVEALVAHLDNHTQTLKVELGAEVLSRLQGLSRSLKGTIAQTDFAQLNLITQEKELYEAAAMGAVKTREPKRRRSAAPPPHTHTWPYEGAWWLDELGYYRVDVTSDCQDIVKN